MASRNLNLVVAVCNNYGIGIKGQLPWKLKGDMAFFKRITSDVAEEGKQNAVVMGRKTWESIPAKFRPLPNRVNIVLSRTLSAADLPSDVHVVSSFDKVFALVESPVLADVVAGLFVIGGSSLYTMAIASGYCHRVFLTRVHHDFECDTFFPETEAIIQKYTSVKHPAVDSSIQTENGISYQIDLFEKPGTMAPMGCTLAPFSVCAAMLSTRGIGLDGCISWPPISKDFHYYMDLTSRTSAPGKKVVNIKGRVTWEESCEEEKSRSSVTNIVISHHLGECPKHVSYVAKSFTEAHIIASQLYNEGLAESIWVLGGQTVYQEAVNSPHCKRIHLTQIHADFPSDRFFPPFEEQYTKIKLPNVDSCIQKENGITFQFDVYERQTK